MDSRVNSESGPTAPRTRKRPVPPKILSREEIIELPHPQLVIEKLEKMSPSEREQRASWVPIQQYARHELAFDFSAVWREFEKAEPHRSVYDGYSPLAKVWSHFTRCPCGWGTPVAPECTQARMLLGVYLAVERHKLGPDLIEFLQLVDERKRRDEADQQKLLALSERLRLRNFEANGDVNLPAVRLGHSIHPVFSAAQSSKASCDAALAAASFVEGRRPKANERTILGNCEAELLLSGYFDEDYVLEHLVDLGGEEADTKATRIDRLYSRLRSPVELTAVVLKPWRHD